MLMILMICHFLLFCDAEKAKGSTQKRERGNTPNVSWFEIAQHTTQGREMNDDVVCAVV